jgi:hypothetical protein
VTISGDAIRDELGHYLSRLWRYALVLSHRRDIADDLVQATCLRALERAAQFTPGSHLDRSMKFAPNIFARGKAAWRRKSWAMRTTVNSRSGSMK